VHKKSKHEKPEEVSAQSSSYSITSLPPENENRVLSHIFIWDFDETLIQFNRLLTESYISPLLKDIKEEEKRTEIFNKGKQLGEAMEELIFDLADGHMFFREIEDYDQNNICDLEIHDDNIDLKGYNFFEDELIKDNICDLKKVILSVQAH